jgi:DNA-binding beta-propeller fold protein YncE
MSRDGCTLLAADWSDDAGGIHEYNAADGCRRRVVGSLGDGPLQFLRACQLWVSSDDFVFVAELNNNRVQVLTTFHAFIGVGQLTHPIGVCANADVVAVSEYRLHRISVFSRGDGALLRRFGSFGAVGGQLHNPNGLCFVSGDRHIAVAEQGNSRVSVFSVDGEFIRHTGVLGLLKRPRGVVCSSGDELVVADHARRRVVVVDASGELLMTMGDGGFTGVAIHGSTVFAQDRDNQKLVVFE